MVQDTLLGFPAHTLPYRCGEFTTLSTVSYYISCFRLSKSRRVMAPRLSSTRPSSENCLSIRATASRADWFDSGSGHFLLLKNNLKKTRISVFFFIMYAKITMYGYVKQRGTQNEKG